MDGKHNCHMCFQFFSRKYLSSHTQKCKGAIKLSELISKIKEVDVNSIISTNPSSPEKLDAKNSGRPQNLSLAAPFIPHIE